MWHSIQILDSMLRGEATRVSRLRERGLNLPLRGLLALIVLLGASYGFCMGWFALCNHPAPEYRQMIAATIKVPALFLLTLLVTFPSLYVFNALVGSRLTAPILAQLIVAALSVALAVLASFGPIVAFFSLTTTSYAFIVLMHVALCSIAGVLGLTFLLQTLHRLSLIDQPGNAAPADPAGALAAVEGSLLGRNVKAVFATWIVVFAVVGAQMSWVLRPFIGSPDRPFELLRARESHFFEAVVRALVSLFS